MVARCRPPARAPPVTILPRHQFSSRATSSITFGSAILHRTVNLSLPVIGMGTGIGCCVLVQQQQHAAAQCEAARVTVERKAAIERRESSAASALNRHLHASSSS